MRALLLASLLLSAPLALSACASSNEPDFEPGVCYHVNQETGAELAYNILVRDQPQIEYCAARLEEMRVQFLRMGGSKQDITGAYQGRYIFINREGVSFAQSLNGARFFALARTGDGRLAIPGAIQRGIDGAPVAVAAPPAPQ
ncbi:hypothetical protein [Brevundimonas sp. PAMC22021]|uniref:hypothetical protein n=1 Tax=Brevundimonas sp. PAMC22021 TaxID=2861285 RepID=UPI001C63A036|nr:hypothetical protein [Brevundimonas sp. PAMC22021]QYF87527.1 hypothetical protein KY493_03195 [Brevundimonas sp. PAMC22021]